ncbi:MAG: SRPBCC domain-containing protein [Elusimicrobia bacterium]|nr:SRPBCC domain-containing protein [Elusimicrobiota bacterium]
MTPPSFKHRDIRLSASVKAQPEHVFKSLTSARELCAWWTDRAETDARNGGRLRLVWPATAEEPAREARGLFVDLEAGQKAAWLWSPAGRGVPPLVTFFIERRRGGASVTLQHAGFSAAAACDRRYGDWSRFWEDCLAKLALYLDAGKTCKAERLALRDVDRLRRGRASRPQALAR